MKTQPPTESGIAYDADGIAFSARYQDRYHPRAGALAQADHVFLRGNELPRRWQSRQRFVVLETGFGLGNNFLATWAAWRDDPARCERLHFISIEKHPLSRAEFAAAQATSPLAELARQLGEAWPPATSNLHRLVFEQGRVQLSLALGDVTQWLPEIVAEVDAFYLDGFAPDRNPEMWRPTLFKALGRLAARDATAATWSVARAVGDGLQAAGFAVGRAPGIGGKREITVARYAPAFSPRRAPSRLPAAPPAQRHAIVVGAGLAGCAAAWALAEQGWSSTVVERRDAVAAEASGNRAGIFHGVVHPEDGVHARFNRAAALQTQQVIEAALRDDAVPGAIDGVIRLEQRRSLAELQAPIDAQRLPAAYVQALSAAQAGKRAGVALDAPAWFYPGGGWVDPARWAAALWRRSAAELRLQTAVAALRRSGSGWQLIGDDGRVLAQAEVVVLANALDAGRLLGADRLPLRSVRGQTSAIAAATPGLRLPALPLAGHGYVLPELADRTALFGATSSPDDDDAVVRTADHALNLDRLRTLTGSRPALDPSQLAGRVGWRCVTSDRLPLIGGVPLAPAALVGASRLDQPRFVAREPGLYVFTALASRGITWAALGARSLASAVTGAPSPLEASLLDGVDAARFAARAARGGSP